MQVLPPGSTGGPSRLFILRPVATTLLMAAILLAGIIGYRFLPVAALPEVDYPTIQVVTLYPGASPDVMTSAVTAPLERQFGQMSGLKQMSSQSSGGASVVTLQFQLTLPLDVAEQEVQAAINAATNLLPSDLPNPPIYSKVNPADPPIMTLAVTSNAMPMTQVEDMVETRVAQKISQVSGVGLVTLAGGQRPAVRVKLNAQAVAALGLTSETIRTAITGANVNSAKGSLDGPERAVTLSANDQMQSADEYRKLIIAYQNGAPVRLGDVATVEQGAENSWLGAWANQAPAIVMNVQRQPGANIIATADSIRQMLPQLTESLPKSVKVTVLSDRTTNIRASVRDTQFELMLAIALVVMIIYLFLRNIPATIIPGVAVPLSLIGTFAVMVFLDFSINNLTLMALTIATGFVVDDAIVVIENISRYIEKGEKPLAAALKGAGEIGFTIISLTFSLIAVLIPLLFMGDIVGRLFREFAVTLAVAILISAVVSLTLTPMMCARMLSQQSLRKQNRFSRACERMFDRVIASYGRGLAKVLNHPWLTLSVAFATLLLSIMLWIVIPKGFFPVQDNGIIQGTLQAPQSSSYASMAQRQRQVAERILQDPAVQSLTTFVGVDGAMMVPVGRLTVMKIVPRAQYMAAMTFVTLPGQIGPLLGPALGGVLVEYASWHWIFLINIPVGIVGAMATFMLMPNYTIETRRFDLPGFLLLAIGMAVLTLALDGSKSMGISPWTLAGLAAGGAAAILLYLFHAKKNSGALFSLLIVPHAHVFTGVAGQFCRAYRQRYAAVYDAGLFANWSWFFTVSCRFDDDSHGAGQHGNEADCSADS